ncbi:hypothetical protein PSYPI_48757, partial [Pseudomonas syringae pv. pisi str. 1704B]
TSTYFFDYSKFLWAGGGGVSTLAGRCRGDRRRREP